VFQDRRRSCLTRTGISQNRTVSLGQQDSGYYVDGFLVGNRDVQLAKLYERENGSLEGSTLRMALLARATPTLGEALLLRWWNGNQLTVDMAGIRRPNVHPTRNNYRWVTGQLARARAAMGTPMRIQTSTLHEHSTKNNGGWRATRLRHRRIATGDGFSRQLTACGLL